MKSKIFRTLLLSSLLTSSVAFSQDALTSTSYRLAKDFFTEYSTIFKRHWLDKTQRNVDVRLVVQSSSKNIKAIYNGLKADTIAVTLASDIDGMVEKGFVDKDWRSRFPNNSSPYYTTMAFLVRKGNPKNIQDWEDLIKPKVSYIFPDPNLSTVARFAIVSALLSMQEKGLTAKQSDEFLQQLSYHLATLSGGGDETAKKFVNLPIIDVLITFEMEAHKIREAYSEKEFMVITPPVGILAEFPVAVIDKVAKENGHTAIANEYYKHMYSPEIQDLLATRYHYRVDSAAIMQKHINKFPTVKLKPSDDLGMGNWKALMKIYFDKGGKWEKFMNE